MEQRKLRVYKKTVSIVQETAISLFEGLARKADGSIRKCFLLESYDKNYDRYSFFGIEPEEYITSRENALVIVKKDGSEEVYEGNPLQRLKEYYDSFTVEKDEGEMRMMGGLIGSLGYDFVRYSEKLPDENPDEIGIETIQLFYTKEFIVIDHLAETMTGVVLEEDTPEGRTRGETKAAALMEKVREKQTVFQRETKKFVHDGKIVHKTDDCEQYSAKVEKIKHYIREGHIFQTVLSQRWTIETKQDGLTLYKELRELNPSPYLYYFNFGEFEIIGSSPEMIVKQTEGHISTCPIAGTRKRGKDAQEDALLRDDLLQDEKERAEHVMLVDLARNDMGRVAEFGSVKVTQFMQVQNYSHVMHIVSLVEGRKQGERHPLELVSSFLPAGTLSGAPKIRAMEIIDELETVRRGLYGGATGYLGFNGNMDFCITIRTMIKKGDKVYLQAGAGIVADSVGEKEYEECCNKVMALAKTLVTEENL